MAETASRSEPRARVRARMNRLPKLRPVSGGSANLNENRSLRISDSSDSATRQRRRSPGGSTPKASRSSPLSPPESIMLTIELSASSGRERRPLRTVKLPDPPPSTTTLILFIWSED